MKKINLLIFGISCFYLLVLAGMGIFLKNQSKEKGREYLIEVNRIMKGMEEQECFSMPDLDKMIYVKEVTFLKAEESQDTVLLEDFFQKKNHCESHVEPLIVNHEILGFVRIDYKGSIKREKEIWVVEGVIAVTGIATILLLCYLRKELIKPFLTLRDMPYELSKGRFGGEIPESKNRFFGKFVWGITMLKDHLDASQKKALRLEKEKKMLLLSISHDIKTPLNSIKLYAKALEEGVYDTDVKQKRAAGQIERLSDEIESFVKKVVQTSSEEIIWIEVENSEFYLKELIEMVKAYYVPKCKLTMTEFQIGNFENRLLKGSRDSAFEVIENIIENAFKYGDGRRIEISFYEEEGCQLIQISNTGIPVKKEEIPHLFDSFYRGSNVGEKEGNGLGLYICKEIMRKMEGEIFAISLENGMSFHLVFQI